MSQSPDEFPSLLDAVSAYRPRRVPGRRWITRSAVALVMRADLETGVNILLMRRSERAGDPWSGHMSLPGGRRDREDENLYQTAVRETREELGLDLEHCAKFTGRLSDLLTRKHEARRPMLVTPYVFELLSEPEWNIGVEAKEKIWVPLAFFLDQRNREILPWKIGPATMKLPSYQFEGRRIWGLTLMMLDELASIYDGKTSRQSGFVKWMT